jgi:hypothetical protein
LMLSAAPGKDELTADAFSLARSVCGDELSAPLKLELVRPVGAERSDLTVPEHISDQYQNERRA